MEENNEYAPSSQLTFEDFVSLEMDAKAGKKCNSVRESSQSPLAADVLKHATLPPQQVLQNNFETTPNVKNRFDFPSLPLKENNLTSFSSSDDSDELDSISMQNEAKSWSKVAQQKAFKTPVRSRILKVSTPPKITPKPSVPSQSATKKKVQSVSSKSSFRPLMNLEYKPPTAKELDTPPRNPKFINIQNDDPIYLIGYHGVIINPSVKLSKPLHRVLQSKISFPVHMSAIDDPTHFCLQYDETALQQLFNNMQRYYENLPVNGLLVHETNLKKDLLVAVKAFNFWHRATICQTTNGNGKVLVMFSDFGHSYEVPRERIRHMITAFTDYPQLFFRAQLAGVSPQSSSVWSEEASKLFYKKVSSKELFAVLRYYNENEGIYEVDLSENLTSSTTVAEDLIQARLAKAVSLKTTFPYAIIFSCE